MGFNDEIFYYSFGFEYMYCKPRKLTISDLKIPATTPENALIMLQIHRSLYSGKLKVGTLLDPLGIPGLKMIIEWRRLQKRGYGYASIRYEKIRIISFQEIDKIFEKHRKRRKRHGD